MVGGGRWDGCEEEEKREIGSGRRICRLPFHPLARGASPASTLGTSVLEKAEEHCGARVSRNQSERGGTSGPFTVLTSPSSKERYMYLFSLLCYYNHMHRHIVCFPLLLLSSTTPNRVSFPTHRILIQIGISPSARGDHDHVP